MSSWTARVTRARPALPLISSQLRRDRSNGRQAAPIPARGRPDQAQGHRTRQNQPHQAQQEVEQIAGAAEGLVKQRRDLRQQQRGDQVGRGHHHRQAEQGIPRSGAKAWALPTGVG